MPSSARRERRVYLLVVTGLLHSDVTTMGNGATNMLVSYRVRSTGKVLGFAIALPAGTDPHHVPRSAVVKFLADQAGLGADEVELLDLWAEG